MIWLQCICLPINVYRGNYHKQYKKITIVKQKARNSMIIISYQTPVGPLVKKTWAWVYKLFEIISLNHIIQYGICLQDVVAIW